MAASDVIPVIISDEVALDADGISTAASVGNNAALTIGGALADGGSVTNASGRQVTILSAGVIFEGRCRLQGFSFVSGGSAGKANIRNTSATGTALIQFRSIGTDSTSEDPFIPANGVLFTGGCYVTFIVGTVDLMMFYHA